MPDPHVVWDMIFLPGPGLALAVGSCSHSRLARPSGRDVPSNDPAYVVVTGCYSPPVSSSLSTWRDAVVFFNRINLPFPHFARQP